MVDDCKARVVEAFSQWAEPPAPHHLVMHPRAPQLFFLCDAGAAHNVTFCTASLASSSASASSSGRVFEWGKVITGLTNWERREPTKEELLLRERMRTAESGITSYALNAATAQFLLPAGNSLLLCDAAGAGDGDSSGRLSAVWADVAEARLDAKLSPDGRFVAYVHDGDIWAIPARRNGVDGSSGVRLTHAHERSQTLWAGEAKFIVQEEFDRFTAYWFCPRVAGAPDGSSAEYRIFFLQEDEAGVADYHIPCPGHTGEVDSFKYPLAGAANTRTTLHMLTFVVGADGRTISTVSVSAPIDQTLGGRFSWCEYIPRCGFCANGNAVWLQLLDRRQRRLCLVTLDIEAFSAPGGVADRHVRVFADERSDFWINVTNVCEPLDDGGFIWASEETGFRQLYLLPALAGAPRRAITAAKPGGCMCIVSRDDEIVVDQTRKLVYFLASREEPIRQHLCCASWADGADPTDIVRISPANEHCESFAVGQSFAVAVLSTAATPHHTSVFALGLDGTHAEYAGDLRPNTMPRPCSLQLVNPEIHRFVSERHGHPLYCSVYRSPNLAPGKLHPVLVDIYGGPHVQQVVDTFALKARMSRQMYANAGFIVVVVDNVGSDNRGLAFEGMISEAMGKVEIADQTEVLLRLRDSGLPLDMSRVAITGWSYGGYASLLALAQQPEIYRIALSCAPVTLWEAYDTGYTERYMGTPVENPAAYANGSVLALAERFPDEPGRLFLVHGLSDENVHFAHTSALLERLAVLDKPYLLKVFPSERHGVRKWQHRLHLETTFLRHLCTQFGLI